MRLIDSISVSTDNGEREIQLLEGDLAAIPEEHAVDVLIVSAIPNDYLPTRTSLVGALHRKGISLQHLAENKLVDLRATCSCWMSAPLRSEDSHINFRQILCFEPSTRGLPPEVVGDVFRAIIPFTGGHPPLNSIAMPILASGDWGYAIEAMLPLLIDAAYQWLLRGLPLDVIKIVSYSERDTSTAKEHFASAKMRCAEADRKRQARRFDVFVSYARADREVGIGVRDQLTSHGLTVFFDEQSIDCGAGWQQQIYDALDACNRVIAVYTPRYAASKVCQDEFNMSLLRAYEDGNDIVFPIYWETADLPLQMRARNYADCRERNWDALRLACERIR